MKLSFNISDRLWQWSRAVTCLAILAALAAGCSFRQRDFPEESRIASLQPLVERIQPGESIAVSYISDAETHDITAFGNLYRDRIEKVFSDARVSVKGRRDLNVVLDDLESFGVRGAEKEIWESAEADIILTGNYRIVGTKGQPAVVKLIVKGLRIKTAEVIGVAEWIEPLTSDRHQLASLRMGNVYQNKISTITSPEQALNKPVLSARLDRSSACYSPGEAGIIHVDTEPGVYLYLLNLAADGTVTLLYPNRLCPFGPQVDSRFVYPPDNCSQSFNLAFYPLHPGQTTRESVKVIASRQPFDFSFLPQPINQVFIGAEGGDIKKVYDILDQARDWSDVLVPYTVSIVCDI